MKGDDAEIVRKLGTPSSAELDAPAGTFQYVPLASVLAHSELKRLPVVTRILLENVARAVLWGTAEERELEAVLQGSRKSGQRSTLDHKALESGGQALEFGFRPSRIILQDFTGVPLVTDLAAMRSEAKRRGADPTKINPQLQVDLVVDHSVQVDAYGSPNAFDTNVSLEMKRNAERYSLLKWAQQAFSNFRVVPPASGIVHQVNLEYLATVVSVEERADGPWAFFDTLVGTDSHTTMISGIGVLGWGVGGIEAEAAMLGEPIGMLAPEVVGVRLEGSLREGVTATDLVLTVTQVLREHGVVGKFVEFFGPGLAALSVPDRATVANMAPEYGATTGFFPPDHRTLEYLRSTGRSEPHVSLVERYLVAQGLLGSFEDVGGAWEAIEYDEVLVLDLATVEPSVAGPRRPQDRTTLSGVPTTFRKALGTTAWVEHPRSVQVHIDGEETELSDGSVVIAAITSCTNTSNPDVMLAAGLLARNAVEKGLRVPPYVKTSLAPGSAVVVDYLSRAGLLPALEKLGFYVVGFGCTTCIGNSGPLRSEVADVIDDHKLVCAAVLSGNRNFEGRIHPQVRLAYLASPPLVVAYALAGSVDTDLSSDPIGHTPEGEEIYLHDIWPSTEEIRRLAKEVLEPAEFLVKYEKIFEGTEAWRAISAPTGEIYHWDPASTYVLEPPFLKGIPEAPEPLADIEEARVLLYLGDSVTTDHISPAGSVAPDSPAGMWLREHGVSATDLHSYGARRGNFEVMVRGTFANPRIRNLLFETVAGEPCEGGVTLHFPDLETMSVYDAAVRYREEGTPLVVLAGKEYGSGSSRDWAAKGTALLGVRAVIAESFERIHRANLVQMGVLPIQFLDGQSAGSLGLRGDEVYSIRGIAEGMEPKKRVEVTVRRADGSVGSFQAILRVDSALEVTYIAHGGILPYVMRKLLS